MNTQHTHGPWESHGYIVLFPGNKGGFSLSACPSPEANASRIVACVNACAGIPTEILLAQEGGFLTASKILAMRENYELRQQRDELLAVLGKFGSHSGDCPVLLDPRMDCDCGFDKAIAKEGAV